MLDGGQQEQDAVTARRNTPEAAAQRVASQTQYHELNSKEAAEVDARGYPEVFGKPAGGPPPLPEGAKITEYPNDFAAQVDLGEGKRAAVDSSQPMAIETAPGQRSPINLTPMEAGGEFEPTLSDVNVRSPKRLLSGIQLPTLSLSLTPVDEHGLPLAGSEGIRDAAVVFYANTQTDTDTVVKPTTAGFDAATMLRSRESPQQLFFKLGLPEGASAGEAKDGSGAVQITAAGKAMATIRQAAARDATGALVPVSMSLSGGTLTLTVTHRSGEYTYPIYVDPEVIEDSPQDGNRGAWYPRSKPGGVFAPYYELGTSTFVDFKGGASEPHYEPGDWGAWAYGTQGISHIFAFSAVTAGYQQSAYDNVDNRMGIIGPAGWETPENEWLGYVYGPSSKQVCPAANCPQSGGAQGNASVFEQYATERGDGYNTAMSNASVWISQGQGPTAGFNTTSETVSGGEANALYEGNVHHGWLRPYEGRGEAAWIHGKLEYYAHDPGIGIDKLALSSSADPTWGTEKKSFSGYECNGVQCAESLGIGGGFNGRSALTEEACFGCTLPDGEDGVQLKAEDAMGLSAVATGRLKIDKTPPYNLSVTGLPANQEIGERQYRLRAQATDGSGSTPSSGVKEVYLSVDGKRVGSGTGSCYPGKCTASGSWTINGSEYAVGKHTITVFAEDYAGNSQSSSRTAEEYAFTVSHAAPVSLGPGSLNPETGEFALSATDVSVASPGSSLTLERAYNSRHPNEGAPGAFGPEWMMSVGGQQSLSKAANGSVGLTSASGEQMVFTSSGEGKFVSPPGHARLTLREETENGSTVFKLTGGNGASTVFRRPSGETGSVWVPAIEKGANETNATTFAFQTVEVEGEKIVEPTEAVAPHPAGLECASELVKGCRALTFNYATSTTASGEGPSQWGDYNGHLTRVYFHAYDPATGSMGMREVAHYLYDTQGRLRTAWNPQISPALKTIYGYSAEGYLTALTPPGQETWAFNYGATASDPNRGRLLSVTRPSASTALGNGEAPVNTAAPAVASNPVEGSPAGVSLGAWSNSPVSYNYQWEQCSVGSCDPIAGATNSSFTPSSAYVGLRLRVQVVATNAGGSTTAPSPETVPVEAIVPTYVSKFGNPPLTKPGKSSYIPYRGATADAVDARGYIWVTSAAESSSKVYVFTPSGVVINPKGYNVSGVATGIAIDKQAGVVYVAAPGKISKLTELTGKLLGTIKIAGGQWASLALDSAGNVWVSDYASSYGSSEVAKFSPSGTKLTHFSVEREGPTGIAVTREHVYVQFHYGKLDEPFTEGYGRVDVYSATGTYEKGTGLRPSGFVNLVFEPTNAFMYTFWHDHVSENQLVEETAGAKPLTQFGKGQLAEPLNLAVDASSHVLYVVDHGAGEVQKWTAPQPEYKPPAPPNPGTSAVWTVDYNVPVSGSGAPYAMGSSEVGAWAQKDAPKEGTAVFPPDEPQGWPAQDYRRASVYYLDASGHTVNVASPGGAIATSEYENEQMVRTLSPDNRAAALKEGAKSAEIARLLDSRSTYSPDGTELLSTLGPQHKVKLAIGSKEAYEEVLARKHVRYSYDEGAPAGGPYRLVTTTTEGAQVEGQQDKDLRTTRTTYSGQENLGWALHVPTAVTTDPSGLKLTHTTVYDPSTGNVKEVMAPAASGGNALAHTTQTIYYSAGPNAPAECGAHVEWAGLPCRSQPATQPATSGLPELPATTVIYNLWDEPERTIATASGATRTSAITYDPSGRPVTSETTSSTGTPLPQVTNKYDSNTGAVVEQSTTSEGRTKSIASVFNTLGQLTSYTDADGKASTYMYDLDGRPERVSDGKGIQTYTFDSTTGELTKLVDSEAGIFTAGYDANGTIVSKGYPNGMSVNYSFDATGQPIGLAYLKTTFCVTGCTWYSDSVTPSIHDQWLSQVSTLSSQSYTYDNASRLTQVQDTPAGQGCSTRIYAYDEDTNRTGLTTREPAAEGKCATSGGSSENHSYDSADRLIDTGASYDAFRNITALPAPDAGGSPLTSTYYVNDRLASQSQNGQTIAYYLDPAHRIREVAASGKSNVVSHYAGSSDSPAWTEEPSSGHWARYIRVMGGLAAIAGTGESPVLQLANLHGDIIATASLSETSTKLLSTSDTTEYGVPRTGSPAKYSWEGAAQRPTELPSGIINMGARTYVPQIGRFEQPDPVEGGTANAYGYGAGDPVNNADPSGEVIVEQPWLEGYLGHPTEVPAPNQPWPTVQPPIPIPEYPAGRPGAEAEVVGTLSFEWGGSGATAARSRWWFDRSFLLPPGQAERAAEAATIVHTSGEDPTFPAWANFLLRHMPGLDWQKLGDDLYKGAAAAGPLGFVEVNISGTIRPRYYHLFILVKPIGPTEF